MAIVRRLLLIVALALGAAGPAVAQAPDPRLGRAQALEAEVLQHLARGEYREAVPKAREVLALREAVLGPHDAFTGVAAENLAELLRRLGDARAARPLFERALAIYERVLGPTHAQVALTLNNLGATAEEEGDPAAARAFHERALAILEAAAGPNHPFVATSLNNLGVLAYVTGDYARARQLHERALLIREQALGAAHADTARSVANLALVLETTGAYATAQAHYTRALAALEAALGPHDVDVARILNNLAELHRARGDLAAAQALHERSLASRERAHGPTHRLVATSLANLALTLAARGDHTGARAAQVRALAIREQTLGPTHPETAASLDNLAALLRAGNDHAAARPVQERAIRIWEQVFGPSHPSVAISLVNHAGHLLDVGDRTAAEPLYTRALHALRQMTLPEWRWRAAFGLGRIRERDGRPTEALALYREAVDALAGLASEFGEQEARARYLAAGNKLELHATLARLLLRLHQTHPTQGYDREAFGVLEGRRNHVAATALAAARPKYLDPGVRAEAERTDALRVRTHALERALREEASRAPAAGQAEKVRALTTLLAQTKAEYLAQVRTFLSRYPSRKAQFVDQQAIDPRVLAKLADRLPAGTVSVQYFAEPDALWIFVVAPGGAFQVKRHAVKQAELYALIEEYRELVQRGEQRALPWADDGSSVYKLDVAPLKAVTRKLSAHLLAPIEPELAGHAGVIVIPNDLLLYLPVHAMVRTAGGTERFLAETHTVSYITQLELVDVLTPSAPSAGVPLLALANPDGTLPGATGEVQALAGVRQRVTTLNGAQATKGRFLQLAGGFPDLHLATHGVLDPSKPEQTHLLMAGDAGGVTRLGVDEISGLSLPGGFAILSACETAVGETVPGAALITLAAAFSQAGSESIVASLWKVSDVATRDFMVALHRALPARGRAASVRAAQAAVLGAVRTAHPFYWAGFILLGAR